MKEIVKHMAEDIEKWKAQQRVGNSLKGKTGNVYTPAPYSHIYRLKTVPMSNDKGSWYGWSVSRVGPIEDQASYDIAKNFRNNLEKGLVKTRTPDVESKSDSPY